MAIIPSEKLSNYLLSPSNSIGRIKARFFRKLGFMHAECEVLEKALRNLLCQNAEVAEFNEFGQKYIVRGQITGPNGRSARVVTIWIILTGEEAPRFVTAYPEN